MSHNSNIPSLTNPPNAPRKKTIRQRRNLNNISRLVFPEEPARPEWRVLAESGRVRSKFLNWTPEDVSEIDDLDTLEMLRHYYTPASQPHNIFEEAYLELIINAVNTRLYVL